ncbi:hypothetical protein Ciccas_000784 [Cichlidogyrus casuarinus]|uniref:PH domain-containing protein n=1 Tax=Cichlidogyrus casuarinus TaxID=1844966 RepID=A0ABD2QLW4_9PLAT
MDVENRNEQDMRGDLLKWTSYLKGYRQRYFILENGVLSYYSDKNKVQDLCRGTISLRNASVHIPSLQRGHFIIRVCGRRYYLKPKSISDRVKWIHAFRQTVNNIQSVRQLNYEEGQFSSFCLLTINTNSTDSARFVIQINLHISSIE